MTHLDPQSQTGDFQVPLPLGSTPPSMPGHDVQFYRTEAFLVRTVVDFLADGLRAGQPLIVIATEPHRRAFAAGLREAGLDTEEVLSGREVAWLDARNTLAAFMEGRVPNPDLFKATVGRVFERMLKKRYYLIVRGYGEMVDLLWKDGNTDGAIRLEELWNELADQYAFALLCAYSMDNFLNDAGNGVQRVCHQHKHALPLEERLAS